MPRRKVAENAEPWEILYRYWLSKHVAGRPPTRSDIDPVVDIPGLVANLMILELDGDGYRYRLAGSEIVLQAGMDMTGRRVGYSTKHGNVMDDWLATLDFVKASRIPRMMYSHFAEEVAARNIVLLLPLHAREGEEMMILVGSFYKGRIDPARKIEGISVVEVTIPVV